MKTTKRILLVALTLGAAMFTQSCEELQEQTKEPVVPNFPETVVEEEIVEGKEVTEFHIAPNMEWKVEVTGEGAGTIFWIDDNEVKETSISGKEGGEVDFKVVFSTEKEFDVIRVCEVKLSMGGKTKVIGTLTRSPKERTLTFRIKSAGEFAFGEDYISPEKDAEFNLVSFPGEFEYTRPVQVSANYAWSLAVPEWCTVTKDGKPVEGVVSAEKGQVIKFVLNAVLSENILGGTDGVLKFIDNVNKDQYREIKMVLPEISSRVELQSDELFECDNNGQFKGGLGAEFSVLSVKDVAIVKLAWDGEKYTEAATDWLSVNPYWEEGAVFQNWSVSLEAGPFEENGVRYADILVMPKAKEQANAAAYLTADKTAVKDEFKSYVATRVMQKGVVLPFLTTELTESQMTDYGATFVRNDQNWGVSTGGAEQGFEIVYSNQYAGNDMEYQSREVIDHWQVLACTNDPATPEKWLTDAEVAKFWAEVRTFGPDKKTVKIGTTPENLADPYTNECIIYLYTSADENAAPAASVYLKYDVQTEPAPSGDVILSNDPSISIRALGENDAMYKKIKGAEFQGDAIYEVKTNKQSVNLNTAFILSGKYLVSTAEGLPDYTATDIEVEITDEKQFNVWRSATDKKAEVIILLKDENTMNGAIVHYIYDPAFTPACPFSFAFPSLVQNATLTSFTGDLSIFDGQGWGALDKSIIWQLTYTGPESQAILNFPSEPKGNAPYNDSAWLSYELQPKMPDAPATPVQVMVNMANKPLNAIDYFVWFDPVTYMPTAILVCTRTAIGWE